jgi:phosphate transport system ATP-binding protein
MAGCHIRIRDLNVWYREEQALKNITAEIPPEGITAIIGPSGCGKSTLLKSLNRLLEETEGVRVTGQVLLNDMNIYSPGTDVTEVRTRIGMLAPKPFPLPMSIYDNVAYGPRIHRERLLHRDEGGRSAGGHPLPSVGIGGGPPPQRERTFQAAGKRVAALDKVVEDHLAAAGLWEEVKDRLRSPASRLSTGQQQRLCLARALAVEPEALLCDEPTSALDPISAQRIEAQLQGLKSDMTIVVVTHILRQARRLADYVVFMWLGELVEAGPAAEVFSAPRDERTQAYLAGDIG